MKHQLADILSQYMKEANCGARRLATRVNQLFEIPHFLHRGTIDNWVGGRSKTVRDWRQIVAVAAALGLSETQCNELLQAAGLPVVAILWEDVASADEVFLDRIPRDPSPFAGARHVPVGSYLPLRANPLFVGREAELAEMVALFTSNQRSQPALVIAGLGGVGKTQLAVEFAHRYGTQFTGGVFWFNFANSDAIPSEIAACGAPDRLNLRPDFDDLPQAEQVRLVQRAWQEPVPRLLIFDGCEDEALLAKWRPTSGGACVLITSRRSHWDVNADAVVLPLSPFSRVQSVALLQKLQPKLTDVLASAIADELGDHPLALHLAGSFLIHYQYDIDPSDYLAQLQALQGQALLEHPSLQGRGSTFRPTGHVLHVARTFALSYEQLQPQTNNIDATAQALLLRTACFAPNELIPRDLLQATLQQDFMDVETRLFVADALRRLIVLGLVREEAAGALRMHQLVSEFVSSVSEDDMALTAVEETLITTAREANRREDPKPIRLWQMHLRYLADNAQPRADQRSVKLSNEFGIALLLLADHPQARGYLEWSFATLEQMDQPDPLDLAFSLNHLGELFYDFGEYKRAKEYHLKALALRQQHLGADDPYVAHTLGNLGFINHALGEYETAKQYYEDSLTIRRKLFGENHADTAKGLNDLGFLWHTMGEYQLARTYFEQAVAIRKQTLGVNHPHTGMSLNNLGAALQMMGHYDEAKICYEEGLRIGEAVLGTNHPSIAINLNNIAYLLQATGHYQEARSHYEKASEIYELVLGEEHPYTLTTIGNLGKLLKLMGHLQEAYPYFEHVLNVRRNAFGEEHPQTALALNNLGLLLLELGELPQAKLHLEQAKILNEKLLEASHPNQAENLHNLGLLMQIEGCYDQAQSYYEKSLAIRENAFGVEHPYTAQSWQQLGQLFLEKGVLTDAHSYLEQALTIQQAKLHDCHPNKATTLHDLGSLYQVWGQPDKADQYWQEALVIRQHVLGNEHSQTRETLAKSRSLQQMRGKKHPLNVYLETA